PDRCRLAAPLVIEEDDPYPLGHRLPVAERAALVGQAAAVHPRPFAVRAAVTVGDLVVQLPEADPLGVAPLDPGAIGRVVPVLPRRQLLAAGSRGKRRGARGAVADPTAPAEAGPRVIGEALRVVALADLLEHFGQVLAVVRPADAGGVERLVLVAKVAGVVRLPVGLNGEPVGMLVV